MSSSNSRFILSSPTGFRALSTRGSSFKVFTIFFSSKAWNLPKTLEILFFVLYDILVYKTQVTATII